MASEKSGRAEENSDTAKQNHVALSRTQEERRRIHVGLSNIQVELRSDSSRAKLHSGRAQENSGEFDYIKESQYT